jgi:hypothetical protein
VKVKDPNAAVEKKPRKNLERVRVIDEELFDVDESKEP